MPELQFFTLISKTVKEPQPITTMEWWEGLVDVIAPYTPFACGVDDYDISLDFDADDIDCF